MKKPRPPTAVESLLTRILPYDLDAKTNLDFGPNGLSFSLEMPLKESRPAPGT